jgi:4-amino-4-deoxy-L-arabinose transferase-like glycosyltransferase
MRASHAVLLLILAGTLVRLLLAATTGLGIDESYMAGAARTLALGYFDHPPLHVWIAWVAERLFGEAALAVRLPFILIFGGTTWLMFRLTARLFNERAGLRAAIALTLAPVFSLADGSWLLPDGPALFFLLAAALAVAHATFDENDAGRTLLWWLATGAFTGLALLSKFNAAFFPIGVLAFLLSSPSLRRHLGTPGPWLAALVAAIIVSPAILWNVQHDWAGIAFQAGRAHGGGLRLDRFATQVGGQLAYLTPWLAVPLALALAKALRRGIREPGAWLMALAAIGPIAVFTLMALWSTGLPHWTMPGWLFAIPLFGRDAAELADRRPRFARTYVSATAAVFVVLVAAFGPRIDPTSDLIDWRELGPALAGAGLLKPGMAVAALNWTVAGKVSYALGPDVPVLCLCAEPHGFRLRADPSGWTGQDMAVVAVRGASFASAADLFADLQPVADVTISRHGRPVLHLDIRIGRNLRVPSR